MDRVRRQRPGAMFDTADRLSEFAEIRANLSALQRYIHAGGNIEILPWVVGIRGFADTKHLQSPGCLGISGHTQAEMEKHD